MEEVEVLEDELTYLKPTQPLSKTNSRTRCKLWRESGKLIKGLPL